MNIDWTLAGQVILCGLVVVFIALIALIACIYLVGAVMRLFQKKSVSEQKEPQKSIAQSAPVQPQPVVENGIEEEIVAVITAAALAAMEESGVPAENCVVTSVKKSAKRSRVVRPIWGFEGLQQNTRPF